MKLKQTGIFFLVAATALVLLVPGPAAGKSGSSQERLETLSTAFREVSRRVRPAVVYISTVLWTMKILSRPMPPSIRY